MRWLLTSLSAPRALRAGGGCCASSIQALRAAAGGDALAAPRALHPAADLRRALHGHFDLDEPEPFRLYSVDFMKDDTGGVPAWNGDPASFEAFATACKWYTLSLKESERRQAASRVWQRLQGAAKSVVRHLDPSEYDATNGLDNSWRL